MARIITGALAFAVVGCRSSVDLESCNSLPPPPSYDPALRATCVDPPDTSPLSIRAGWSWSPDNDLGHHQVLATPVAVHLNDDNGDTIIGAGDYVDLVFTAYAGTEIEYPGHIMALSGYDGSVLWTVTDSEGAVPSGGSGLAAASLSPGANPLIIVASNMGLLAVDHRGQHKWIASIPMARHGFGHPALGDVDNDGVLDVAFGRSVVDSHGDIIWMGERGTGGTAFGSFFYDLDDDGSAELIAGNTVYDSHGGMRHAWDEPDGWPAVGDMNGDEHLELLNVAPNGVVYAHDSDGGSLWEFELPGGGGGPPAMADFDADGRLELAVAGYEQLVVINGDGTLAWSAVADDRSSGTAGVMAFDFDNDSYDEVVYADQSSLRILDGATGHPQLVVPHGSITAFETPILADLDADGSLELAWGQTNADPRHWPRGITTLSSRDRSWVTDESQWPQHARIAAPAHGLRRVSPLVDPLAQPNLRLGRIHIDDECDDEELLLWVAVENTGRAASRPCTVDVDAGAGSLRIGAPAEVASIPGGSMVWAGPWPIGYQRIATSWRVRLVTDDDDTCDDRERVREFALPATTD